MKRALRNLLALAAIVNGGFVCLDHSQPVRHSTNAPANAAAISSIETFAVVVLDPGHGGRIRRSLRQRFGKDLTLDVARRIDRLLDSEGVATLMTRLGDAYVSLADRAAFANRVRNCIFVSIHFNEDNKPVATGVETYYAAHQITAGSFLASWLPFLWRPLSESPNPESQNLAGFMQEALVARTRAVDRGTQARQFFVIANVTAPAVLIEGGFLTNKEDISRLASEDYRNQIAAAISDGILRYREAASRRQTAVAATNRQSTE
jgi:N-acetylmuramoyl-L-alanine amidase